MDLLLPRYEVERCGEDESVLSSLMLSLGKDNGDDLGPCGLVAFATDVDLILLPLLVIECPDGDEFLDEDRRLGRRRSDRFSFTLS